MPVDAERHTGKLVREQLLARGARGGEAEPLVATLVAGTSVCGCPHGGDAVPGTGVVHTPTGIGGLRMAVGPGERLRAGRTVLMPCEECEGAAADIERGSEDTGLRGATMLADPNVVVPKDIVSGAIGVYPGRPRPASADSICCSNVRTGMLGEVAKAEWRSGDCQLPTGTLLMMGPPLILEGHAVALHALAKQRGWWATGSSCIVEAVQGVLRPSNWWAAHCASKAACKVMPVVFDEATLVGVGTPLPCDR